MPCIADVTLVPGVSSFRTPQEVKDDDLQINSILKIPQLQENMHQTQVLHTLPMSSFRNPAVKFLSLGKDNPQMIFNNEKFTGTGGYILQSSRIQN